MTVPELPEISPLTLQRRADRADAEIEKLGLETLFRAIANDHGLTGVNLTLEVTAHYHLGPSATAAREALQRDLPQLRSCDCGLDVTALRRP